MNDKHSVGDCFLLHGSSNLDNDPLAICALIIGYTPQFVHWVYVLHSNDISIESERIDEFYDWYDDNVRNFSCNRRGSEWVEVR